MMHDKASGIRSVKASWIIILGGISSALRTLLRETQVIVLCNRNWGSKQSRSDYCLHAGSENNEIVENAKTEFGEKHLEQIVSLPEFENALLGKRI